MQNLSLSKGKYNSIDVYEQNNIDNHENIGLRTGVCPVSQEPVNSQTVNSHANGEIIIITGLNCPFLSNSMNEILFHGTNEKNYPNIHDKSDDSDSYDGGPYQKMPFSTNLQFSNQFKNQFYSLLKRKNEILLTNIGEQLIDSMWNTRLYPENYNEPNFMGNDKTKYAVLMYLKKENTQRAFKNHAFHQEETGGDLIFPDLHLQFDISQMEKKSYTIIIFNQTLNHFFVPTKYSKKFVLETTIQKNTDIKNVVKNIAKYGKNAVINTTKSIMKKK